MPTNEPLAKARVQDFDPSKKPEPSREQLERELEHLRQREALLYATEQVAKIGHYEWNYELDRLESCSEEYAHIFGMTVAEVMVAQNSWEKTLAHIHPEDHEHYRESAQLMHDDKTLDVEYRVVHPDGEIRHIREIGIVVTDDDGFERGTFGILQDITSQIKHERDLEYRDELARQAESVTDIGHFIYDEELERYTYMSDGCARIYGTTAETYMSRMQSVEDDLSDVYEEDRARVAEEYRRYRESGKDCSIEYRICRADGEVRWVRELGKAKQIRNGVVKQTLGVVQDITYQIGREQELVFKDAIANQAEAITDFGFFLFDGSSNSHVYVSEGAARIVGMSVEEFLRKLGRNSEYLKQVHESDREQVRKAYHEDLIEQQGWEIEYRVRHSDGDYRWVREIVRVHKTDSDGTEQTIGVIQDITTRKNIEQELLFKDALAKQAEAITDIGHFVYDEINQNYIYVSSGLLQIHGRDKNELVDEGVAWERDMNLIHVEDRNKVKKVFNDFLVSGDDWQVEYRMVRADGEIRWIREMGKAHTMNHGIPEQTIGVLQDITEQKMAEQEIIKTRDTLEQQVVERTRELANTVKQLQQEVVEREKIAAELDFLANHDALTGLPSLRLCKDRLDRSLAEARRNRQMSAVMFLDLDGFKAINDSHGHELGDRVLKVTAERIQAEIRETDTVARIGGDEFVIILTSLPELEIVNRIAANLIERIVQKIHIDEIEVQVSASLGISLYPENGTTAEELIREADKAMYEVKHQGKNNFGFSTSNQLD